MLCVATLGVCDCEEPNAAVELNSTLFTQCQVAVHYPPTWAFLVFYRHAMRLVGRSPTFRFSPRRLGSAQLLCAVRMRVRERARTGANRPPPIYMYVHNHGQVLGTQPVMSHVGILRNFTSRGRGRAAVLCSKTFKLASSRNP